MDRLLQLLRSLGPVGATANAHHLLLQRQREDIAVRSLARRLVAAEAAATRTNATTGASGRHAA